MFASFSRQCPPRTMPYYIKPGDTFFKLARQFNITVLAITAANPLVNPNSLRIGQVICIPILPPCPEANYYTVKPGDSLYRIARFFNVSLDALVEANPAIDPDNLLVGQIMCIPLTPPVTCKGQGYYIIEPGDTLSVIAQKYNTTVQALINSNPGINPQGLLIGQKICIPD